MSNGAPTRELSENKFAAIGKVVVYWSHLETIIEVGIWSMLGITPRVGTALSTPLRFRQRMDIFRSIARDFFRDDPDKFDEFKKIWDQVMDAYGERNQLDHAIWWEFPQGSQYPAIRVRLKEKHLPSPVVDQMTAEEISKTSDKIEKVMFKLNDFLEANTPPPPSSQEKSV